MNLTIFLTLLVLMLTLLVAPLTADSFDDEAAKGSHGKAWWGKRKINIDIKRAIY